MRGFALAALAAASVALSGCMSMAAGAAGSDFTNAILEIAKDPACGHTDRINVILGALPSGTISLERHCPAPGAPAAAGQVVGQPIP